MLNLVIKPLWLITEFFLQDSIGHQDWGTYAALSSLALSLAVFTDLGINQYTIKSLASDTDRFPLWFPSLLGFKLLLMLLYPLILLLLGLLMGYSWQHIQWLMLIAISLSAIHLVQFLRSTFQAFQHFKLDAFASVLDKILLMVLALALLLFGLLSMPVFLTVVLLSSLLSLFVFIVILYRKYPAKGIRLDTTFTRRILKLSFPFALITIVYALHDKIDKVMLEEMAGAHETGLYAAASRWVDALMMYTWIIMGLYYARFAKNIRNISACAQLLQNGKLLGALPMIPACIILTFLGKDITASLLQNSTDAELEIIQAQLIWLALSTLINSTFVIYSTYLTATGHERIVTRMVAISILLKVGINYLFIPQFGGLAAAIASLISFAFLSALYVWITANKTQLPIPWKTGLHLLVLLIIPFLFAYFGIQYLGAIVSVLLALLIYILGAWYFSYLTPMGIKRLLQ
jgi:O-antigen/teichoic acid export membrane protein